MLSEVRNTYIVVLILAWISQPCCYAQQTPTDTAFLSVSKNKSIELYTASIQQQSRLYNGSDYIVYLSRDDEHPYFKMDDWVYGSIVYWNELYENVPLLYDIHNDLIITEHIRGNPLKLISEKVERFTLLEHTFVRLNRDEQNKISDGFYDRLYDGESKVYARHSKAFRETLEPQKIIHHFDENTRYYLVKDGIFNVVKSKRSVLGVLRDQKQNVKNFIRKNRISFHNNRETAIVRITEFYDTLQESR
jgi:hypothetical protein